MKKNLEYTYFKEKQWSHHITVSLEKEAKQLQQKIVRFYCFEMNIKVRMFGSNIKALRVLNSLKPSIHPFQIHYYFNSEPLFMLKIKETNLWTISDFSTFLWLMTILDLLFFIYSIIEYHMNVIWMRSMTLFQYFCSKCKIMITNSFNLH